MYEFLFRIVLFQPKMIAPLIIVIVLGVIYFMYEAEINPNVPPRCNSSQGYKIFKKAFEESPYARKKNLQVVDVEGWTEQGINFRPVIRKCRAKLVLGDGTSNYYVFSFEANENQGYHVRMNPK